MDESMYDIFVAQFPDVLDTVSVYIKTTARARYVNVCVNDLFVTSTDYRILALFSKLGIKMNNCYTGKFLTWIDLITDEWNKKMITLYWRN